MPQGQKKLKKNQENDRVNIFPLIKKKLTNLSMAQGAFVALLFLVLILSLLSPVFFTAPNMINIARQSAVLALMSLGLTVVLISGGIDLSVGPIVSIVGVATALLIVNDISWPVALLIVIGIGAVLGLINGILVTVFRIPAIIATLATSISFGGVALLLSGGYGISIPLASGIGVVARGSIGVIPAPIFIMLGIYSIAHVIMRYTSLGRIIYAIGGNEETVRLSGISVRKYRIIAFVICGITASMAGFILAARVVSGQPRAGEPLTMNAIAGPVLGGTSVFGGIGSVWGTLVGVLIITVVNNGLNLLGVTPYWQFVVRGMILAGAVAISALRMRDSN